MLILQNSHSQGANKWTDKLLYNEKGDITEERVNHWRGDSVYETRRHREDKSREMDFKLKWVKCFKRWGSVFNNWKISMSVWINEEEFGMWSCETGSVAGTQNRREIFVSSCSPIFQINVIRIKFRQDWGISLESAIQLS